MFSAANKLVIGGLTTMRLNSANAANVLEKDGPSLLRACLGALPELPDAGVAEYPEEVR